MRRNGGGHARHDPCNILNLVTEQCYGLDAVGTAVWKALTETGRVGGAVERLTVRYQADPEILRRDLDALVDQLRERGVVHVGDRPDPADPAAQSD
jgi:hypothetical protein